MIKNLTRIKFEYVKKLTSVNAINLALLASSPPPPQNLKIGGIVEPSVKFKWDLNRENDIIGYKIYWRKTSSANWEFSKNIGIVNEYTLENIIIDNYLFSIVSVNKNGFESIYKFPSDTFR